MIEHLSRFRLVPRYRVGMSQRGPDFGMFRIQLQRFLKRGNRLRHLSFLLIRPAQKAMIDPVSLVKINGAA
jgi:hypothetical protein